MMGVSMQYNSSMSSYQKQRALDAHHYQFDGSHPNRNECALCAMTTLLHRAARASTEKLDLTAVDLGRYLDRIPFRHARFPAWFPGPGGATHPRAAWKGLNGYIRQFRRRGLDFPWRATRRTRQTQADLAAALAAGELIMIYGVGTTGVPHAVVPLERQADGWLLLDPGFPRDKNPVRWSEDQLAEWWTNFGWVYPAGTLVSLTPR